MRGKIRTGIHDCLIALAGLTVFLQHQLLFVVLSACAVLSTLAMCFIMPLRAEEGGTAKPKVAGWKNVRPP